MTADALWINIIQIALMFIISRAYLSVYLLI